MIEFSPIITLHDSDVRFEFSRSGGAGGQNVNKRSTQATLYFNIPKSKKLNDQQKTILMCHDCIIEESQDLKKIWNRINSNGDIVIKSSAERSQDANRAAALQILNRELNLALSIPKDRILKLPKSVVQRRKAEANKKRTVEYKKKRILGN